MKNVKSSLLEKLAMTCHPTIKLEKEQWRNAYHKKEKRKFKSLAKFYFAAAALAYVGHFLFVDLRLGKTPLELWALYRFGLATLSLLGFCLCFHERFMMSRFHKFPLALIGLVFSFMQAQTMLWLNHIPYFYAFLIPSVTAIVLRLNILSSLAFVGFVYLLQYNIFKAVGLATHLLVSAELMSAVAIIIFRSNMLSEVDSFISEQLKDDMQLQLNAALHETRTKEKALAYSNHELRRSNQVFHTLLESATSLPHLRDLSDLLQATAKELKELFPHAAIAVVVQDENGKSVAGHACLGLSSEIETLLLRKHRQLATKKLSNDLAYRLFGKADHPFLVESVNSLPLLNAADERIGSALLIGVKLTQDALETASLLLALVTSCVENLMLTAKLELLAHTDKLTSTYNRNFFDKELERQVKISLEGSDEHFSLILVDVNGLKHINDKYGHEEGDKLIQEVALLLKNTCRKTDLVCRMGGDEFVILCPETKNVEVLEDRLRARESGSELEFRQSNGQLVTLPIRFSMGIASTTTVSADCLLRTADEQMYTDKRSFYQLAAIKKSS